MSDLLTTVELAERIRYTPERVRALARAGLLPFIRIVPNGPLRFDPAEVEQAIRKRVGARPAARKASGKGRKPLAGKGRGMGVYIIRALHLRPPPPAARV